MKYVAVIVAGLLMTTAASASEEHTIQSIDNNGVVTMDDGSQYQADDSDMVQNWNNGETVVTPDSDDKLINTDRGEDTDADPQ